jgi:hypothetical protein
MLLQHPSTTIICGASGCGKTTLTERCVSENCFDGLIKQCIWCYSPLVEPPKLNTTLPVQLHSGWCEEVPPDSLLVIDDLFTQVEARKLLTLFNIISHHRRISVILIVQDLYTSTPGSRQLISGLLRSTSYLVLFPCRRNSVVAKQIANQYFPKEQHRVMSPFRELINSTAHDYVVVDFVTKEDHLQVRQNSIAEQDGYYFTFNQNAETFASTDT